MGLFLILFDYIALTIRLLTWVFSLIGGILSSDILIVGTRCVLMVGSNPFFYN